MSTPYAHHDVSVVPDMLDGAPGIDQAPPREMVISSPAAHQSGDMISAGGESSAADVHLQCSLPAQGQIVCYGREDDGVVSDMDMVDGMNQEKPQEDVASTARQSKLEISDAGGDLHVQTTRSYPSHVTHATGTGVVTHLDAAVSPTPDDTAGTVETRVYLSAWDSDPTGTGTTFDAEDLGKRSGVGTNVVSSAAVVPAEPPRSMDAVPDHVQALLTSALRGVVSSGDEPRVYIIGEDHMRMQPLLEEMEKRGVPTTVWNTEHGVLNPTTPPPPGLYFCRQSPSAGCREHITSIPYAKQLLAWLDIFGARVINGSRALEVETSKALQLSILHACGLNTPDTILCQGLHRVQTEARHAALGAGAVPVLIKPNTGGSGTGIESFATPTHLVFEVQHNGHAMVQHAHDGLWLLQSYLGEFSDDVTAMRSILRIEVVGGRVQRDYFIKITAPSKEFGLCPCDPRGAQVLSRMQFMLIGDPLSIPGFQGRPEAFDTFCNKVEAAFRMAGSSVGSIEAVVMIKDQPEVASTFPCPHEPVIIDFNTCNTNYNTLAEEAANIPSGVSRVADMLVAEYEALAWKSTQGGWA